LKNLKMKNKTNIKPSESNCSFIKQCPVLFAVFILLVMLLILMFFMSTFVIREFKTIKNQLGQSQPVTHTTAEINYER